MLFFVPNDLDLKFTHVHGRILPNLTFYPSVISSKLEAWYIRTGQRDRQDATLNVASASKGWLHNILIRNVVIIIQCLCVCHADIVPKQLNVRQNFFSVIQFYSTILVETYSH